jgi:hypothetical protein
MTMARDGETSLDLRCPAIGERSRGASVVTTAFDADFTSASESAVAVLIRDDDTGWRWSLSVPAWRKTQAGCCDSEPCDWSRLPALQEAAARRLPADGSRWQSIGFGPWEVIGTGLDVNTREGVIFYRDSTLGGRWKRTLANWSDWIIGVAETPDATAPPPASSPDASRNAASIRDLPVVVRSGPHAGRTMLYVGPGRVAGTITLREPGDDWMSEAQPARFITIPAVDLAPATSRAAAK